MIIFRYFYTLKYVKLYLEFRLYRISKAAMSNMLAQANVATGHLKCGQSKFRCAGSIKYVPDVEEKIISLFFRKKKECKISQ